MLGYNEKYIESFSEKNYLNYLSSDILLSELVNNYNCRYKDEKVNGILILFQESLDNYIIKRIKKDSSFINSIYFSNYKKYLNELIKGNNGYFFHSTFLHAFDKEELQNMLGNNFIDYIEKKVTPKLELVKKINNKILNNDSLTQRELNIICDVYSFNRDVNNKYHKKLIEYIFNNFTNQNCNLVCSEFVLDTIFSFVPKYYPKNNGFNPIDSRIISDDININGPGVSHGDEYVLMNRNYFKNTNFKSFEDSKKTYVKRGNDFTFLMIVTIHEFVHQYQSYMSKKDFFSDAGFMSLKMKILAENLDDYKINHDNDEIEVDATEKGWNICGNFFNEIFHQSDIKDTLVRQCYLNEKGTANRRFTYLKEDDTRTIMDTSFYDIQNLNKILLNKPNYISKYPILKKFYDEKGNISLNFLCEDSICLSVIGADYMMYMCLYYPRKVLNFLKTLTIPDLNIALNNLSAGFSKNLKKINYFDYNQRLNLTGEYKKNINDDSILLMKHYKKLLELYRNVNFILSDNELLQKKCYINSIKEVIERTMNFSNEQYEKMTENKKI